MICREKLATLALGCALAGREQLRGAGGGGHLCTGQVLLHTQLLNHQQPCHLPLFPLHHGPQGDGSFAL
jgi:hypothetical protein